MSEQKKTEKSGEQRAVKNLHSSLLNLQVGHPNRAEECNKK